jgi:hypothetical protein
MSMWQCGRCNASFSDFPDLESHASGIHGERIKAEEPRVPHSSPVKPLGPSNLGTIGDVVHEGVPQGSAQDLRTGASRVAAANGPQEKPHPTSMTAGTASPKEGRGRPPP